MNRIVSVSVMQISGISYKIIIFKQGPEKGKRGIKCYELMQVAVSKINLLGPLVLSSWPLAAFFVASFLSLQAS